MEKPWPNVWRDAGSPPLAARRPDETSYALIDAAQVRSFTARFGQTLEMAQHAAVLGKTLAPDRYDATPHVLGLDGADTLTRVLSRLAESSESHGALSVLVSRRSAADLAQALRRRLDLTLPEGLECMNRFYDARVAPHWVECLTGDQRRAFCAFASQWWVLSHEHRWIRLECQDVDPDPLTSPIQLDDRQQALMVDACYPYAVIDHFTRTDEELLERVAPQHRYALFASALNAAAQWGLADGADGVLFCTLAITRGERFFETEPWRRELALIKQGRTTLRAAAQRIHD